VSEVTLYIDVATAGLASEFGVEGLGFRVEGGSRMVGEGPNFQPYALIHTPSTLHPKPYTLNPAP
jgi:hypothetical protein